MKKKTAGEKLWDVTRKKMQDQVKNTIYINGKRFEYECSCKEHNATCLNQEMIDALSEEVYDA